MFKMPGRSHSGALPPLTEPQRALAARLQGRVEVLAGEIGERNAAPYYEELRRAAAYLESAFADLGYEVGVQEFEAAGRLVRNIEVELSGGERAREIVVVGAHYDSVVGSPGANDNATGVAAMLEIAGLLKAESFSRTVRFVAFVNEEPPYYYTNAMGSLRYARRCKERKEKIVAMLSLETIGYYSDEPRSQVYPPLFRAFYPDVGNFVAFVSNVGSRALVRRCVGAFRRNAAFPSEGAAVPGWITGIGWSDHWSFWKSGYPAVMVTDTAPFRYPDYHAASDTPDKVDYERLARVTLGLSQVVRALASGE